MRKLYNEFFYIPKHGKVREKVMLTRVVATVAIVVMCLVAISFSAYAYFSHDVTSSTSMIKAATFETKVEVQITDSNGKAIEDSNITPITSDHKNYVVEGLEVGKYYTVTITPTTNSTAKTGFVVVTADNCLNTYHTQQLAKDVNAEGGETPSITFKLMITDETKVFFLAHWGTSSYYDAYKNKGDNEELYITQNEEIKMVIKGHTEPDTNKDTNEDSGDSLESDGTNAADDTSTTPPETTETSKPTSATEETLPSSETTETTSTTTDL